MIPYVLIWSVKEINMLLPWQNNRQALQLDLHVVSGWV